MTSDTQDSELAAIRAIVEAISPLEPDARVRALAYVIERFEINFKVRPGTQPETVSRMSQAQQLEGAPPPGPAHVADIRSLTALKAPKSAIEMAALVAYHLQYEAPLEERKEAITADDVKKYFHLAKFRLPGNAPMTLVHSRNAGYLDQQDRGHYKLNAVGYNLVMHRLPGGSTPNSTISPATKRKGKARKKR